MPPSTTAPAVVDRAAIVDEYGDLQRKAAEFKPTERRLEEIRKVIQSWYETEPAVKDFRAEGKRFDVLISAREFQRKVNPLRLYKKIGIKRFLTVCSVTLEAMKAAGMEALQIYCVDETQTGKRKLTAISRVVSIADARKERAA